MRDPAAQGRVETALELGDEAVRARRIATLRGRIAPGDGSAMALLSLGDLVAEYLDARAEFERDDWSLRTALAGTSAFVDAQERVISSGGNVLRLRGRLREVTSP